MRRRLLTNTINYEFIDMGLSVKWATYNIGANSPEEYGYFFQWGGTIAYNSDRTPVESGDAINFGFNSNCPHWVSGTTGSSKWSKYTTEDRYSSTGTADNKLILDLEDDAAHVHWGGDCRMPTEEEFSELINACVIQWATNYKGSGINGSLFTLKSDNSKTLFFPATGSLSALSWTQVGSSSRYWSSTLSTTGPWNGRIMQSSSSENIINVITRGSGLPIRAVLPK